MKLPIFLTLALAATVSAETLRSAKITQAVQDVKVYTGSSTGRTATIGENIDSSSSVTTGRRSRAELTFQDQTITRLGQNSVFSFRSSSREVELKQGSILLQVPKDAGGATIRTATVTAAITGTTSMFEYNPGKWVKLITLEGSQKLYIKGVKDPIVVPAGMMVIVYPDGSFTIVPITIDIKKLIESSALMDEDTFGPLPPEALKFIEETIDAQKDAKRRGHLVPTNEIITGPGSRKARGGTDARTVPEDRRIIIDGPPYPNP